MEGHLFMDSKSVWVLGGHFVRALVAPKAVGVSRSSGGRSQGAVGRAVGSHGGAVQNATEGKSGERGHRGTQNRKHKGARETFLTRLLDKTASLPLSPGVVNPEVHIQVSLCQGFRVSGFGVGVQG